MASRRADATKVVGRRNFTLDQPRSALGVHHRRLRSFRYQGGRRRPSSLHTWPTPRSS